MLYRLNAAVNFIRDVAANADRLEGESARRIEDHAFDLLAMAVSEALMQSPPEGSARLATYVHHRSRTEA